MPTARRWRLSIVATGDTLVLFRRLRMAACRSVALVAPGAGGR
jgi:hypothetical protein